MLSINFRVEKDGNILPVHNQRGICWQSYSPKTQKLISQPSMECDSAEEWMVSLTAVVPFILVTHVPTVIINYFYSPWPVLVNSFRVSIPWNMLLKWQNLLGSLSYVASSFSFMLWGFSFSLSGFSSQAWKVRLKKSYSSILKHLFPEPP